MKRLKKVAAAMLSVLFGISCMQIPAHTAAAENPKTETGISCAESTETILNPGMGYTSTLWYRCAPGKTAVQNPSGALVLMFIDIGAFSSGENGTTDDDGNVLTVHTRKLKASEIIQLRDLLRIAILYTVGYLFEHREEADHHDLTLTLRNLLFAIREGVV